MQKKNTPAKKRRSILWAYFLVALGMAVGVLLFVMLYRGQGAATLFETEERKAQQEGNAAMQVEEQAAPTPTPAPPSVDGRLFPYLEQGLWGYKNGKGQVVMEPRFNACMEFRDEGLAFAAVEKEGSLRYGLLTRSGMWAVEPTWSDVSYFEGDLAAVAQEGLWGYIDTLGTVVIPYQFEEAYDFFCGRARVRIGGEWGYIDRDGDVAIKAEWQEAGDFSEDMAFATQNGKGYIINKVGQKIVSMGRMDGKAYVNGYAAVRNEDGSYSYFNKERKRAFSETWEDAGDFSKNGFAPVKLDGKWGYINKQGAVVIDPIFNAACPFENGLAPAQHENGGWGYIDVTGEGVTQFVYSRAEPFLLGYGLVEYQDTIGVVNTKGEFILLYE